MISSNQIADFYLVQIRHPNGAVEQVSGMEYPDLPDAISAANRLSGGGIRHGTGNEDEDRILRFYQKGGDGEVDTNPIAMLSKGEVFQLGLALGVPASILTARPSPDLWGSGEQHNDEDEIAGQLGLQLDTRVGGKDGLSFYSYVDIETREYKNVGLIERLSRYCDISIWQTFNEKTSMDNIMAEATLCDEFKGIPTDIVYTLLLNARKIEAATRHKMNPNCPTLGDRKSLLAAGILTNELPV